MMGVDHPHLSPSPGRGASLHVAHLNNLNVTSHVHDDTAKIDTHHFLGCLSQFCLDLPSGKDEDASAYRTMPGRL